MVPEQLKEKEEREKELKKLEKELYSKECVAESINFVVGAASVEATTLTVQEIFSCNLATILARDKEVVAVWMNFLPNHSEIYLTKNFAWLKDDVRYINKIMDYLKSISKNAPVKSRGTERAFAEAVTFYCSAKLESRLEKLKNDIENNGDNEEVKSFIKFFSTKVNDAEKTSMIMMSRVCNDYYKEVKDDYDIPSKFLGHIKKVGSYAGSIKSIIGCARNIRYKPLFSKAKVLRVRPDIMYDQPIYSWENIIKRFVDEDKYERFMDKCSKKSKVVERRRKVYTDKVTNQQQQLDGDDVKQRIYLHAEMKLLSNIIDNKINSREFIAVSKRCCYLCELYIDFAWKQGYKIIVPGNHKKIYSGWKLPDVKDSNFKINSLKYILENLDRIIENKINHYTRSLPGDSDSDINSSDPINSDGEDMDVYFEGFSNKLKKFTLLKL
jgi:hypothetical protein